MGTRVLPWLATLAAATLGCSAVPVAEGTDTVGSTAGTSTGGDGGAEAEAEAGSTADAGSSTTTGASASTSTASGATASATAGEDGSEGATSSGGEDTGETETDTDGVPVDPSDALYDAEAFPTFEIVLPPESIAALQADPGTYVRAEFRHDGEVVADVGVHLKGEYTFRDLSGKASFKLKFDEFVPDREFRGLRRMTFNNSLEAESFVAERLSYEFYRAAGLPAPRCNNARLLVNGEYWGVYVNLETEDKTFLARWFDSNDGNLYEELGAEFEPGNEQQFELETNESIDDRSDLTALIEAVDAAEPATFFTDVGHILDVDAFLDYCAAEALVNQWDGYCYTRYGPNNFRVYHDPSSGRFFFLPWGMDMSMASRPESGEFQMPVWQLFGLIIEKCLEGSECEASYRAKLAEMVERFEALGLPDRVERMYAQIEAAVREDPRKEIDDAQFEAAVSEVHDFVEQRPDYVRGSL